MCRSTRGDSVRRTDECQCLQGTVPIRLSNSAQIFQTSTHQFHLTQLVQQLNFKETQIRSLPESLWWLQCEDTEMLQQQKDSFEHLLPLNVGRPSNSRSPLEFVGGVRHFLPCRGGGPCGTWDESQSQVTIDEVTIFTQEPGRAEPGQQLNQERSILCQTSWSYDGVPVKCAVVAQIDHMAPSDHEEQMDTAVLPSTDPSTDAALGLHCVELQQVGLQLEAVPYVFSDAYKVSARASGGKACCVYPHALHSRPIAPGKAPPLQRNRRRVRCPNPDREQQQQQIAAKQRRAMVATVVASNARLLVRQALCRAILHWQSSQQSAVLEAQTAPSFEKLSFGCNVDSGNLGSLSDTSDDESGSDNDYNYDDSSDDDFEWDRE